MSHEVMITRRQSISNFFQIQGAGGLRRPVLAGAGWYWLLSPLTAWICKIIKNALSSGYHGTSNFDHQTLIRSDLNYTNAQWSVCCVTKPRQKKTASTFFSLHCYCCYVSHSNLKMEIIKGISGFTSVTLEKKLLE